MPDAHACRPLPFGEAALEPVISARTLGFHHGKHYPSYVANVNAAVAQTAALRDQSLTQLLLASSSTPGTLFDNVAQAWNHEFYFDGLAPCDQGGNPGPDLLAAITRHSGSLAELKAELVRCATLAPSSHNTQCWKFSLQDKAIAIRPDMTRRCPAVDPDDHRAALRPGQDADPSDLAIALTQQNPRVPTGRPSTRASRCNAAPSRPSTSSAWLTPCSSMNTARRSAWQVAMSRVSTI
ncbi:MAG: hypothetical protein HC872_09425, partial [Gammaproteobacteria bacterium]|nr:hypothetical protein [Gammaproteobacteria bacterium]